MCECSSGDPTMFFALLAAGGLLAGWMVFRGLKMKANNVLILVAVVVVVAGVAWFQSSRAGSNPDAAGSAGVSATTVKLPRVVDLGSDKCIPCIQMAPFLAELKQEYAGRAVIEFIDVRKHPAAGIPYQIRIIPTQVFFDAEGNEVWRHEGFLPKEQFVAKFAEMGVK